MVVGLFGNESPDSNRFTLVTPKPENGVRLQATLQSESHGLAHGSSQPWITILIRATSVALFSQSFLLIKKFCL